MEPFKFKLFTIKQDKCAMKVGTDGVLLGAWVSLHAFPNSILDIGTGTGIIALQLAQRSKAEIIDAIEIDNNAFEQAVENFENSPWNDRIFCYHVSLAAFTNEIDQKYDLIISNPPFYNDEFESNNEARNKARFTSSLSFENLLVSVSKLLSGTGTFTTIIPYKEEANFIKMAEQYQLKVNKICRVQGNKNTEIKRSLLEFSKDQNKIEVTQLIIEKERHQYTDAYQKLVKDFYLKM
ncbi:MAG: methyltransferase [Aureibaculum sp.]